MPADEAIFEHVSPPATVYDMQAAADDEMSSERLKSESASLILNLGG